MKKIVFESLEEYLKANELNENIVDESLTAAVEEEECNEDELEERDETVSQGLITPEEKEMMNKGSKTGGTYGRRDPIEDKKAANRWAKKYGPGRKHKNSAN